MQQFVVPQFIDVEAKIFGPITVRQFLMLVAAAGVLIVAWKLVDLALFAVITLFVGGGTLVMAFVPINGRPFHYFVLNIMENSRRPKKRIWRKDYNKEELNFYRKFGIPEVAEEKITKKKARPEAIRDLSLLVNTGGYYKPDLEE